MNHPVRDVDGRARRIDAVWLDQRVAVELDSKQEHGTLLDWNDDIRREAAIVLAGDWRAVLPTEQSVFFAIQSLFSVSRYKVFFCKCCYAHQRA